MKKLFYFVLILILKSAFLETSLNAQDFVMPYRFQEIKEYRDTVNNQLLRNDIDKIEVQRYFELAPTDTAYLHWEEEELLHPFHLK